MADRRKDMWRLLYNVVNRDETELYDVFVFVNDILCQEPSLIRHSLKATTNKFQDTFILWLVNKLMRSLNIAEEAESDIFEKNLKTQHKLLNSCLVNRIVLFEKLLNAYINAIDQLCEAYTKLDGSSLADDRQVRLKVTAFSTEDHSMLQEIDPLFNFPIIEINSDDIDGFIQALLHILGHGLYVGYINYPSLFQQSIFIALKALKVCDFSTKLCCLQYIAKVFERAIVLDDNLHCMYELSLRALTTMWNYLPIWLANHCLQQNNLDDFIDESCAFVKVLQKFIQQIPVRAIIERHCFQLYENLYEIQQWWQNCKNQTYDLNKMKEISNTLTDFVFILFMQNPRAAQLIDEKYLNILLKYSSIYPQVLRAMAPHLARHAKENQMQVLLKHVETQLTKALEEPKTITKHQYNEVIEYLTLLNMLEHLHKWTKQMELQKQCFVVEEKSLANLINSTDQKSNAFNNFSWERIKKSIHLWLSQLSINTQPIEMNKLLMAALIVQSTHIFNKLSASLQEKLIDIILQPLTFVLNFSSKEEPASEFLQTAEMSLNIVAQIPAAAMPQQLNRRLAGTLTNLGKRIFCELRNENHYLAKKFVEIIPNIVANNWLALDMLTLDFVKNINNNQDLLLPILKILACLNGGVNNNAIIWLRYLKTAHQISNFDFPELFRIEILCQQCFLNPESCKQLKTSNNMQQIVAVLSPAACCSQSNTNRKSPTQQLTTKLKRFLIQQLFTNPQLDFVCNHFDYCRLEINDEFLNALFATDATKRLNIPVVTTIIGKCIEQRPEFIQQIASCLLRHIIESVKPSASLSQSQRNPLSSQQQTILEIITSCTQSQQLTELWLFHFFKMTFFYLIHPESRVVNESILCATEMCSVYNKQPVQLWNWYKRDALNLIVKLMIYVYLSKGVRMTRSLKAFTKMLGFSCVQEFICKYYRLLVTMILPYCVKEPRCKGLLISISKITRKPINNLFIVSFLRIYTHIYLTEEAEIGNSCIQLIGKCTGASLSSLMNTDVKQTVSEFLVYFNRSPTFVMQAFKCLLPNEVGGGAATSSSTSKLALKSTKSPTHEFGNFIADRFLGVITYFQACLSEPYFEKPLKEETLYSLGQIMRLIGPSNVTQFRFKIIAMLSFVLTLDDRNLQSICLKIWQIFLKIVNISELGPSLSRIVASFQPLIDVYNDEINDIYEYLILKNDNLLGVYISDLYFLKDLQKVKPAIRHTVARQTELLENERDGVEEKLIFLYNQICNENSEVRIYGLNYLASFIAKQRRAINHMILNSMPLDPLIEQIVDEVIKGCRHEDGNINLASAKCLGELGAIDPSYMSANFCFMSSTDISLSIHTDEFAIMALTELCKAYQFQKDTKYVDNFSLAIQETLAIFGISPKEDKKLNVWNAMPVRMQQIMEPLLTSCYTGSRKNKKIVEHPLFNSSLCRSYEKWSFAWACRLIDLIEAEETKRLLEAYKPSIRRDSNMLSIFFPYILLNVLLDCEESKHEPILEEFLAVFNFCSRDTNSQQRVDICGFKEFKSSKYAADKIVHNAIAGGAGLVAATASNTGSTAANQQQHEALETVTQTCTKLCSEQIDFLQRWLREWQKQNKIEGKAVREDNKFQNVSKFVQKFNKSLIAKANYNSGEYARALLYLEEYIEKQPKERLQEQLSFLIEIHGKLMDSDSVEGAVYLKETKLTLEEQILVNRLVDRPQETINCYQQLLLRHDVQLQQDDINGIMHCYLRMDTPESALLVTDGLWQQLADQYTDDYFKECKSELLWRLGRYDDLQQLLEDTSVKSKVATNWNIQCAEAFLLFRETNNNAPALFEEQLDVIRSNIIQTMRSCSGVTGNSYTHSYDEATRLHLLNELQKNKAIIQQINLCLTKLCGPETSLEKQQEQQICLKQLQNFFINWEARLKILEPKSRILEPVICFRRNLLLETQKLLQQNSAFKTNSISSNFQSQLNDCLNEQIVKLWLHSIQMNRDAGCLQQADISVIKAEPYNPPTLFLEKAKLLWQKSDHTNCFKLLEDNIKHLQSLCQGDLRNMSVAQRQIYAEAKFLQASYNAESMNVCSEINLKLYKDATAANRGCEKYHVHYAQYMEKMYDALIPEEKESAMSSALLIDIMMNYAKSLRYGYQNVYQSLPRILSIWLDYTSNAASVRAEQQQQQQQQQQSTSSSSMHQRNELLKQTSQKINDMIKNCVNILPMSLFYTALSQLLSRICHPSEEVFDIIRNIVVKLLEHFPQQTLWMLLPIFKSCHTNRAKRCRLILGDARLQRGDFQKLFNDFNMLAERLIELTNKECHYNAQYTLSTLVRQLPLLFADPKFSKIMLPFEKYMQASFPISSASDSSNFQTSALPESPTVTSNPFHAGVYICDISEEVVILRSAAKPKKITIRCTDGLWYNIMVKPKDDLRKDFRLMEFNGLVKRHLHQDPQARHRHLRIRTYAAIPFNEECGLVEWLPNLASFRGVCTAIYRTKGLGIDERNLRKYMTSKTDPIAKKRQIYGSLLAYHPPIFHEWFRQEFHSPHSWYQARNSYVKTTAVMSIVGYILGLGDRHGENILLDETNGDAVHVDFNCLFNQGETFAVPEVVPFRLTHNMTSGMGPLGVEGLYRKCCEITLRVLKDEAKTLMSVLRPFFYDIGSINRLKAKAPSNLEITDPKAVTDVNRIEDRLKGYVKRTHNFSIPFSTEGHVNFLINEATDYDNLASMYVGWGSYF